MWGADVTAAPLNLCAETLDGIRNHSWSRPSPSTPEGQVVGLADRVAYCAHDLEDAVHAGVVAASDVPAEVAGPCGPARSGAVAGLDHRHGRDDGRRPAWWGCPTAMGEALAALRRFNHERIYLRPESVAQADAVIAMLRALVEHYIQQPDAPATAGPGSRDPVRDAVAYVDGMTDRFACAQAVALLAAGPPAADLAGAALDRRALDHRIAGSHRGEEDRQVRPDGGRAGWSQPDGACRTPPGCTECRGTVATRRRRPRSPPMDRAASRSAMDAEDGLRRSIIE